MNTEQYIKLFQTKAEKQFQEKAQALADMRNGLLELRAYKKSEEQNVVELVDEIAMLESQVEPALKDAASCDDLKAEMQKFKDKLAGLRTDLITSRELILTLKKSIPQKQTAAENANEALKVQLNNFVRSNRHVADNEIKEWLEEIIEERKSFLDAFTEIYKQFGVGFIRQDASLLPGGLTREKIAALKKSCGLTIVG